jgi:hypothetical protein
MHKVTIVRKIIIEKEQSVELIVRATGIARHVVVQYINLINLCNNHLDVNKLVFYGGFRSTS